MPSFGPATLAHPDERFDPAAERWTPAREIPQLALVLAAKERAAHEGRFLAPEPTVRDLPVLGAILEQAEKFEEALLSLRAQLGTSEDRIDAGVADGRAREAKTDQLRAELAALDARFQEFNARAEALRRSAEELAQERAALQAGMASWERTLADGAAQVAAARADIAAFKESAQRELSALKTEDSSLALGAQAATKERAAHSDRLRATDEAVSGLKDELAALRESDAARWRLGRFRLTPRRLLALIALVLLLAALGVSLVQFHPWDTSSSSSSSPG